VKGRKIYVKKYGGSTVGNMELHANGRVCDRAKVTNHSRATVAVMVLTKNQSPCFKKASQEYAIRNLVKKFL
jgi:hypothetical protein